MRGEKLFKDLLRANEAQPARKGRKNELVEDRNNCLMARYYFYGHVKGRCYEDIIQLLTREFFLSPYRIHSIVLQHATDITDWKEKNITLYQMSARWPHLSWRK